MELASTRDFKKRISFQEAIQWWTAPDKWLYRPTEVDVSLKSLADAYAQEIQLATESGSKDIIRETIKRMFVEIWKNFDTKFTTKELEQVVNTLDKFVSPYIVPIEVVDYDKKLALINETTWPTDAFKDLALQMLTEMISIIVKKQNEESIKNALNGQRWQKLTFVVAQTSTSWDTWPAGGSGILWKDFIMNTIGYPIAESVFGQQIQMEWLGDNVFAIAMKEAFTPIQEAMKKWNTPEFRAQLKGILEKAFKDLIDKYGFEIEVKAGSFNSVNIWRIYWQATYHTGAYSIADSLWLVKKFKIPKDLKWKDDVLAFIKKIGVDIDKIDWIQKLIKSEDFDDIDTDTLVKELWKEINKIAGIHEVIPSGNFGHAYAVILAKKMGLNIDKIIISSNENDEVYRLIKYGKYRHRRDDEKIDCPSVSMIISYGSNIEWLFALLFGDKRTKELMEILARWEEIQLTPEEHQEIIDLWLVASRVSTEEELLTMRQVWLEKDRLICPHTANAYFSAQKFKEENPDDDRYMLISETASPWKFVAAVAAALSCDSPDKIKGLYFQYREKEKNKEWVAELMEIIKAAYAKHGRKFDENEIPQDLREIYKTWVAATEVHSCKDFMSLTLDCVEQYAPTFVQQVENTIEKLQQAD